MHQSESQYGVSGSPSLPNFVTAAEARGITCHALGISGIGISGDSTPSLVTMRVPARSSSGFEEVIGRFGEEEGLASEEGDRGLAGNRWPRQETLALLKIRSDMDATFRDSTLKGPLWENVSRKLAELGYHRTAKKCKEKFENVHKYYKRTKVGRAGRQDGKSYRFFTQLEALNSFINPSLPNPSTMEDNSVEKIRNFEIPAATITNSQINSTESQPVLPNITADFSAGIRFSSDSSSGEDCGNPTEDYPNSTPTRKRKRSRESSTKKILGFFENLMKQVIEKQEILQQRFLEAIEKREQDRMIREEAWRRQELTRLSREQEIFMQERSTSASKDAAVIAFLQKITGQTVPLPENHPIPQSITTETESPQIFTNEQETVTAAATTTTIATITGNFDPACSRWPKAEVQTLIKLRSELETKYQETGPKGPLWEEISSAMKQHGYNRSSKRCKEKWENINKYFKKVKESNKRRPEDAKTCPYYHQLDALYKKKMNEKKQTDILSLIPAPATDSMDTDCPAGNSRNPIFFSGLDEAKKVNERLRQSYLTVGKFSCPFNFSSFALKPEDLVMEMVGRRRDQQQQSVIENLERTQEEEDDEEDGNDDGELCPKIGCEVQYDRLTNTSVREVSSFMAMVQ